MPPSSVPAIEPAGEAVIGEARDRTDEGQAQLAAEPAIARRPAPDLDRAIGADMEPAFGVDAMKAAAHRFEVRAEPGKRRGLEIDVAKLDNAGLDRARRISLCQFR